MMYIVLGFMLLLLAVYICIAVKGPSVWDRLLCMSLVSSKVVTIIIIFASVNNLSILLDIAIVCILLGFIGTIFTARFILDRIRMDRNDNHRQ